MANIVPVCCISWLNKVLNSVEKSGKLCPEINRLGYEKIKHFFSFQTDFPLK